MKLVKKALPLVLFGLSSCQTTAPIQTAEAVDLNRFMGDWFVLAHIPTFLERNAFNAVETYRLNSDGSVFTRFSFNRGAPDGPRRSFDATGYVRDQQTNAEWGMQFIWPFKAEYRVLYVDDEYRYTVIGRTARDYAWIMARSASVSEDVYSGLTELLVREGYELEKVRRIPHDG